MRRLLIVLAVVILSYSVGLLWYIGTDPQPGIHCLLRGANQQGPRIAVDPTLDYLGQKPASGDRLLALGGERVPTFVHFHRRLGEILSSSRQPVAAANLDLKATDVDLPPVADVGDDRWVRIDFLRDEASSHVGWVRLRPPATNTLLFSWAWFLLELLIFGIGALVVWRRPGDVSAALFYVLCAVQVVMFLGAFHWPSLVDTRWLIYPMLISAVLLAPLMLHFHLLFPRPAALVRRWRRPTLISLYALPGLWLVLMFACLIRLTWLYEIAASAEALAAQLWFFTALMYAYLILSLGMFMASQALVVRNFLRARTPAERNQMKWLLTSMIVAIGPVGYLLYTSTWQPEEFVFGLRSKAMMYMASAVFALGYAVSITRYKLLQASRIVDRGLVYVAISFAATLLFCGTVGLGTMLVGRYYSFSWAHAAAAGLTAMLMVVLLGLARDRFQRRWIAASISKNTS